MKNLEVVFDNAGGITIQDDEHALSYGPAAEDAAECVRLLLNGQEWQEEYSFEENRITDEMKSRSDYQIMGEESIRREISFSDPIDDSRMGTAQGEFLAALTGRRLYSQVD